jgi:coproporphyrinogen III oxidase
MSLPALAGDPVIEPLVERASGWFATLRDRLCAEFEALEEQAQGPFFAGVPDAGRFIRKPWQRTNHDGAPGGGGVTAMLKGRVFEKLGVHISTVHGTFSPEFAAQMPGAEADPHFLATGISVIAHPWNPHAPTAHMNTRFVITTRAWFGGGADLTPVLDRRRSQEDSDALAFHAAMRRACERTRKGASYERYKEWCDEYFFLKHRGEPRGIGGIFFDDLADRDFDFSFRLTRAVADQFLTAYTPILERRKNHAFGLRERDFQAYRRGRYVEFNLVYDRGTLFGLQSGGRAESILMSLPPRAAWRYDWKPEPGSPEAKLYTDFLRPRDWI